MKTTVCDVEGVPLVLGSDLLRIPAQSQATSDQSQATSDRWMPVAPVAGEALCGCLGKAGLGELRTGGGRFLISSLH